MYFSCKKEERIKSNPSRPAPLAEFTFNTWGFAPSPYPEEDPQRHGKAAYAGLVTQPAALEYKKKLGDTPLEIVEIGCGTAAGELERFQRIPLSPPIPADDGPPTGGPPRLRLAHPQGYRAM